MGSTGMPDRLAFIGFGEAATAFLAGWDQTRPARVTAFDIKTEHAATRQAMLERYAAYRVNGAERISTALDDVELAFSLVTADQALTAARSAAPVLPQGALWLDGNSCSPGAKRAAAAVIEAAGGRYADVAVMAPVYPKRHRVPLLVSGPDAALAQETLSALGMCPTVVGDAVGQASSIKMLRSVMVKGLEALTAECLLGARRAGVEDQVLASLEASDPDIAWRRRGAYNLERMMLHGARRAAEMREVAVTVGELGLPNGMSAAAANWQDAIAAQRAEPGPDDLIDRIDRLLATL